MPPPPDRPSHVVAFAVAPGDIDELGHVNNLVYLRWVQDEATAHWRAAARPEDVAGLIWVVTRHEIDYLRATFAGETVTATTWVGAYKGARFDRFVEIAGDDGRLKARAETMWALVDPATMRPLRVTEAIAAPFLQVSPSAG